MMVAPLLVGGFVAGPPNIVYIMADDLGYGEIGAYGQKKIKTPNLDRLAKEGVRFTQFYAASPVCAPTRCSLLTGRHTGRSQIRGNKELAPGFGPNDPEGQWPLAKGTPTIATTLKTRGYRTALVGKWGLGGPGADTTPLAHGFDRFYGFLCQKRAHNHYPEYLWSNGTKEYLDGNTPFDAHQRIAAPLATEAEYVQRFQRKTFAGEKLHENAVKFIRDNAKRPFYLYYAPTVPHLALQAPPEWIAKQPRDWDAKPYLGQNGYLPTARPRATYAAMIEFLDDSVGRLMTELDRLGLRDHTLVVFTSDNGPTSPGGVDVKFFDSAAGLRGLKMSAYEGGIRMPFIARWPGRIKPNTVTHHAAACYDTLATLAEVAGARAPANDGLSYLAALEGRPQRAHEFLYFEYPEADVMQAVRMGSLKAIRPNLSKKPDKIELYDLDQDPNETHDLAAERPDDVRRAKALLEREHVPNPTFPLRGVDRT